RPGATEGVLLLSAMRRVYAQRSATMGA
ncbi:MAG: hypothetical protein RLY94_451, partial [Chloroflexota bacterium]